MFPHGADAYIDGINALVPLNEGNIRTALDTGCGVSDWSNVFMILSVIPSQDLGMIASLLLYRLQAGVLIL